MGIRCIGGYRTGETCATTLYVSDLSFFTAVDAVDGPFVMEAMSMEAADPVRARVVQSGVPRTYVHGLWFVNCGSAAGDKSSFGIWRLEWGIMSVLVTALYLSALSSRAGTKNVCHWVYR